jgi:bacteriocin biosynthesis cyclodehydratase domain-containing protein
VPDPDPWQRRRPRLAYPFTVLTQPDTVRLVAGEDYRYSLTGPSLEQWLPAFLSRLTGAERLDVLLAELAPERHAAAVQLVQHLYGERVLVDGPAAAAHVGRRYRPIVQGNRELAGQLAANDSAAADLVVLCQDTLDYDAVLQCNRRCRQRGTPWLWVSTAALNRAYVSPLFLADAGPCFGCLLRSFQRVSPAPELYDALLEHARGGGSFRSAPFPAEALLIVQGLVRWKLQQAEQDQPAAALYRLHVVELETLEVAAHRVFRDPECPQCHEGRP